MYLLSTNQGYKATYGGKNNDSFVPKISALIFSHSHQARSYSDIERISNIKTLGAGILVNPLPSGLVSNLELKENKGELIYIYIWLMDTMIWHDNMIGSEFI